MGAALVGFCHPAHAPQHLTHSDCIKAVIATSMLMDDAVSQEEFDAYVRTLPLPAAMEAY